MNGTTLVKPLTNMKSVGCFLAQVLISHFKVTAYMHD